MTQVSKRRLRAKPNKKLKKRIGPAHRAQQGKKEEKKKSKEKEKRRKERDREKREELIACSVLFSLYLFISLLKRKNISEKEKKRRSTEVQFHIIFY